MRKSLIAVLILLVQICFSPIGEVSAEKLFKYIDEHGNLTFTDRQIGGAERIKVEVSKVADPEARFFITLRGSRAEGTLAAINRHFGPIEVRLELEETDNVVFTPELPAHFVVPARGEAPTVTVRQRQKNQSYSYRYSYSVVFGDPGARHSPERPYRMPVPVGKRYRISQAFNGAATHNDEQNYHAVDIPMPEGTPVHAARGGIIMDVADGFASGGTDLDLEQQANYIRILHDDGTMAVYAHLKIETMQLPIGSRVARGQMIALSGNTGYSSGPHLHFVVQRNAGMKLKSIPFKFAGADGRPVIPREGMLLASN